MIRTAFRTFGFTAVALAGLWSVATSSAAAAPDDLSFNVIRGGEPMGSHTVAFRQDGDKLTVEIAIELEVRLAFIPVFRYSHRNSETWQNGKLIRLETTTNDDGTKHKVFAEATAEGLRVTDSAGKTYIAPADTIPTSYWNIATVQRSTLLNSQDGKLMPVRINGPIGADEDSVHYRIVMTEEGNEIDVWYDKQSRTWNKLSFEARGSKIEYQLSAASQHGPQQAAH